MNEVKCDICGNENASRWLVKMYDRSYTNDKHESYLCGKCFLGWLQTS